MSGPTSFLRELLSLWVQWPIVNHPTKPTLGALCDTLCSSLVGLGQLAETVERELKCSIRVAPSSTCVTLTPAGERGEREREGGGRGKGTE